MSGTSGGIHRREIVGECVKALSFNLQISRYQG